MKEDLLDKIKRLTIAAFVSDELLVGVLVLKGGNAIGLAYDLTNRGSLDIDFSIETDFSEAELDRIRNQSDFLLNTEFMKEGLRVFDVVFSERPKFVEDSVKDFWGGYLLQFKITTEDMFGDGADMETVRRQALAVGKKNSTKFQVDISKYEFVGNKRAKDIDGSIVYVYSPEMLALEKLRAVCQQNPLYKEVVFHMTSKARARDFYDIHNLVTSFAIDLKSRDNFDLAKVIFEAKKVPLDFIGQIDKQRELHRAGWESVLQTISQDEEVESFDFYFDFVRDGFSHFSDQQ